MLCDDDQLIISSLRGLFSLETDYELLEFTDPAAAAEEVRRRPVDLVISDFLMPEINGVELLKRVRQAQPEAIRILLTGFADKENAIRAINEVGLYHYLEKPWDNENLLLLVRNALNEKGLRRRLSEKVAEFEELIERHSRLSDRHASLERELDMAARVQRSLLPTEPPQLEGYEFASVFMPSSTLGGDFYDFAQTADRTVFLLADASGHGVQSALSSVLLKASFQEAGQRVGGPAELLSRMNANLHRFMPTGMYACATLIWMQAGEAEMQVANAGLPHPRVLRKRQGQVDELPLSGMPLGLFENNLSGAHDIGSVVLEPGDTLMLASDGLGDVRDDEGRFFEDARLDELLAKLIEKPAQEVLDTLAGDAAAFNGSESLPDDLTMIALGRR